MLGGRLVDLKAVYGVDTASDMLAGVINGTSKDKFGLYCLISNGEGEIMVVKVVIPMEPKHGRKYDIVKLVEWKVKEEDRVEKGNIVLVVETEKAIYDIEAEASGFLHILVPEGDKTMVGSVVGLIAESKEELEELEKST